MDDKRKKNGRKFKLYLVTECVLICTFIVTLVVRPEAITEISLGAFLALKVIMYLIYVHGNVKSKFAFGQLSAEFGEEKKDASLPPD